MLLINNVIVLIKIIFYDGYYYFIFFYDYKILYGNIEKNCEFLNIHLNFSKTVLTLISKIEI